MPHFIIECPESLLESKSPDTIMQEVFQTAESSNLFAKEGPGRIKVRINSYSNYHTAGIKEDFIHVFGNIMEGRSIEQKSRLSQSIVDTLKTIFPEVPVISMNIQEFEKSSYSNLTTS